MRRTFFLAMAFAVAACRGKVPQPTGAGGSTQTGAGGAPSTASVGEGAGGAGGAATCHDCACAPLSQGGCFELCTCCPSGHGTTNPNFCDGSSALSQCAACIATTCGVPDPAQCM